MRFIFVKVLELCLFFNLKIKSLLVFISFLIALSNQSFGLSIQNTILACKVNQSISYRIDGKIFQKEFDDFVISINIPDPNKLKINQIGVAKSLEGSIEITVYDESHTIDFSQKISSIMLYEMSADKFSYTFDVNHMDIVLHLIGNSVMVSKDYKDRLIVISGICVSNT